MGVVSTHLALPVDFSAWPGLNAGAPYADLTKAANLLQAYLDNYKRPASPDVSELNLTEQLKKAVQLWSRKPNLLLAGHFDAGKTRIANTLLGGDRLPADYTPATKLVTIIRHESDRPAELTQSVYLLRKGYDFPAQVEESSLRPHIAASGGFDLLNQYGVHGYSTLPDVDTALVFASSPFLRSCNIIDCPGYDASADDSSKTDAIAGKADLLVYISPVNGFLGAADILHLDYLIKSLPAFETISPSFPTLGNLFVVASHAAPHIRDQELARILDKRADELSRNLRHGLWSKREKLIGRQVDVRAIRARLFGFWFETRDRWQALESALVSCLGSFMKAVTEKRFSTELKRAKAAAECIIAERISAFERLIAERAKAKQQLEYIRANEPKLRNSLREKAEAIQKNIQQNRHASDQLISQEIRKRLSKTDIERFIRESFTEKDEAVKFAVPRFLAPIETLLGAEWEIRSKELQHLIEDYLANFSGMNYKQEASNGEAQQDMIMPFDARGAFIGALGGLATIGGLAVWAASLGNLGGYILVAKFVSLLSAVGISVGGTASAASLVAAFGGPLVLALGLGVLIAFGIGWIFRSSWQERLATQMFDKLTGNDELLRSFLSRNEGFWKATESAFGHAESATWKSYEAFKERLATLTDESKVSVHELESTLAELRALQAFVDSLPWPWKLPKIAATANPDKYLSSGMLIGK